MRLAWYAGASTALAVGVVVSAFHQRANFYSAMVYLSQSNFCLIVLVNFTLMAYAAAVYGLQRLCFGTLRPVETEQLYERTWYAITETLLAMTMFRDEIGAWFLVMFASLVTGRVWGWIGDGRVEILEQQPPANPRLFHARLCASLSISLLYDILLLRYAATTVIQQARPTMMVMFLFEFAILAIQSVRTVLRYSISIYEQLVTKRQTREGLEVRRRRVRDQRADILRRREAEGPESAAHNEELPNEEDVDEIDIEVPGWEAKGLYILGLELFIDALKCAVYILFFSVLLVFFTMPLHIMRDLFFTFRSLLKRINAIMKYRKALKDMEKYPDATQEELSREDTCIICREEMRPWDPSAAGAVERSRPKKLPCGHILHFGCLKSWLERQQVCPTCRRPVTAPPPRQQRNTEPLMLQPGIGGEQQQQQQQQQQPQQQQQQEQQQQQGQQQLANNDGGQGEQRPANRGGMRVINLGPIRIGFAQGDPRQLQEMAQQFGEGLEGDAEALPRDQNPPPNDAAPGTQLTAGLPSSAAMRAQLMDIEQRIQQELTLLNTTYQELATIRLLQAELNRIRTQASGGSQVGTTAGGSGPGVVSSPALPSPRQQPQLNFPAQPGAQPPVPNLQWPLVPTFPPRVTTPTVTRHVGPAYGTAIPAGSPDLPEGVQLPPGWSLLPLQRLDGTPLHNTAGATMQNSQILFQLMQHHLQALQMQPQNLSGDPNSTNPANLETGTVPAGPSTTNNAVSGPLPPPRETPSQSRPGSEPVVTAPTPVMPNWGGRVQLFGSTHTGEEAAAAAAEQSIEGDAHSAVSAAEPAADRDDGTSDLLGTPPSSGSSSKGAMPAASNSAKGKEKRKEKAVTVEDASDEEDG